MTAFPVITPQVGMAREAPRRAMAYTVGAVMLSADQLRAERARAVADPHMTSVMRELVLQRYDELLRKQGGDA